MFSFSFLIMNLQNEHIVLCLFMMSIDELTASLHVQHHSDSGGYYKQQNMLGLGKTFFL